MTETAAQKERVMSAPRASDHGATFDLESVAHEVRTERVYLQVKRAYEASAHAKDGARNNAAALKEYLDARFESRRHRAR